MANSLQKWINDKSWNTWNDLSQVEKSFDRLYNDFVTLKKANGLQSGSFAPSCEITEEGGNYIMRFDMPGVTKDNIKVEVERDQLTIRAERKEEKKQEDKKRFLSEISYGSYLRTFVLPGVIDEKKIDAKFENGVLTVTFPKVESSAKTKQISVQ